MYSTSIKNNRFYVQCITVFDRTRAVMFIIDTGAIFTCCTYKAFDKRMRECELENCETKFLGGLVKCSRVKFYKCALKQFTIGSINMGEQNLWITFDERVTDTVLGMDILQQVIFTANPYNKKIYFCKDIDDYHNNFELLTA